MKVLYDFLSENQLEIEDIDIQLHVYTYPMTKDFLAYCKENQYVFKDIVANGPPEEFAHYDFTYNDIDSMEYVTNCTEETGFSVGTCAAAGFNFSIFAEKYLDDESIITYDNIAFKGAIVLPVFDFYYKTEKITGMQIGVFHCRDYEEEDGIISFTCLDNMYKLDKKAKKIADYVNVPLKSKELLRIILEDILNLAIDSLGESDVKHFQVNKVTHLKKITYRTIASYALELIAGYGFFNAYGEFHVDTFRASKEPIGTISYDDVAEYKKTGEGIKINGYSIQYEERGVASFYYPAGEDEEIENPIPLTIDNPLLYGKKQENIDIVGERMDKRMYGFTFTPYEVTTFIPDFRIQAGDFVNVEDKNGEIHKILVSQLTLSDNLEMEIVSAFDVQEQESSFDSEVNEAIQRNEGIDDVILDTDDEEVIEIDEVQIAITGKEFNTILKQLVNTSASYTTMDTSIYGISLTDEEPVGSYGKIDTVEGVPIKAYLTTEQITCNDGVVLTDKYVVNLYTPASKIYLPSDSSYMFYGFKKVWSLDVSYLDASTATNCAYMFSCLGYNWRDNSDGGWSFSHLILGDKFNTSNVTNMNYMFYRIGCDWSDNPNESYIDFGALSIENLENSDYWIGCGAYGNISSLYYIYAKNQNVLDLVQSWINNGRLRVKRGMIIKE